jgi:hypothetical protein
VCGTWRFDASRGQVDSFAPDVEIRAVVEVWRGGAVTIANLSFVG